MYDLQKGFSQKSMFEGYDDPGMPRIENEQGPGRPDQSPLNSPMQKYPDPMSPARGMPVWYPQRKPMPQQGGGPSMANLMRMKGPMGV